MSNEINPNMDKISFKYQLVTPEEMQLLEESKEKITELYCQQMSDLYTARIKETIRWFMEKFPKRTIKWHSGMGTNFWEMDGEILHWSCMDYRYIPTKIVDYGDGVKHHFGGYCDWRESIPDRRAEVLWPLWNLFQSINDVTNFLGADIDTGDITMEDV